MRVIDYNHSDSDKNLTIKPKKMEKKNLIVCEYILIKLWLRAKCFNNKRFRDPHPTPTPTRTPAPSLIQTLKYTFYVLKRTVSMSKFP